MPPGVFPHHVEQHLNQVKRDIGVLEAQVNALKKNSETDQKPWRQNSKFIKSTKGNTAVKAGNEFSRRNKVQSSTKNVTKERSNIMTRAPLSLPNGLDPAVAACLCCQNGVPCVGQVSTRICSKNHVHHTIKIPASAIQNHPPMVVVNDDISSRKTWREALQQSNRKERSPKQARSPSSKVVSHRPDPKPTSDSEPQANLRAKKDALWADQLELLQKEVRCAREEKDKAQREAAVAKLAIGKFEAIVEAQAASRENQQRSIQLLEDRIKEMILKERREAIVKMVEEFANWPSSDASPHTTGSASSSSSQRFRASSPAKSDTSDPDSHMSWHDLSSIKSLTFNTL